MDDHTPNRTPPNVFAAIKRPGDTEIDLFATEEAALAAFDAEVQREWDPDDDGPMPADRTERLERFYDVRGGYEVREIALPIEQAPTGQWVLILDTDAGLDAEIHPTEAAATQRLAEIVRERWTEEYPDEPRPDDPLEMIETFFNELAEGERADIQLADAPPPAETGPTPVPAASNPADLLSAMKAAEGFLSGIADQTHPAAASARGIAEMLAKVIHRLEASEPVPQAPRRVLVSLETNTLRHVAVDDGPPLKVIVADFDVRDAKAHDLARLPTVDGDPFEPVAMTDPEHGLETNPRMIDAVEEAIARAELRNQPRQGGPSL